MSVALMELKIRIMPPADADNELMDKVLKVATGGGTLWLGARMYAEQRLEEYLRITGLQAAGFTATVEEITE